MVPPKKPKVPDGYSSKDRLNEELNDALKSVEQIEEVIAKGGTPANYRAFAIRCEDVANLLLMAESTAEALHWYRMAITAAKKIEHPHLEGQGMDQKNEDDARIRRLEEKADGLRVEQGARILTEIARAGDDNLGKRIDDLAKLTREADGAEKKGDWSLASKTNEKIAVILFSDEDAEGALKRYELSLNQAIRSGERERVPKLAEEIAELRIFLKKDGPNDRKMKSA